MRIIISPAKKMNINTDSLHWKSLPDFMPMTEKIHKKLKSMSYIELKNLWKCNEKIAQLNYNCLKNMDLYDNLTPAILSYEGIQYNYMAPNVFTYEEIEYIKEHLKILSAFYGMLRPFDGVTPYRLEMQAKLSIDEKKNLYEYWNDKIALNLLSETKCIINLASKEYSKIISKHLPKSTKFITCVFGEKENGKIIEKGTLCKMARGEMVRYMAENQINSPKQIQSFNRLNYKYMKEYSNDNTYVFLNNK